MIVTWVSPGRGSLADSCHAREILVAKPQHVHDNSVAERHNDHGENEEHEQLVPGEDEAEGGCSREIGTGHCYHVRNIFIVKNGFGILELQ